MTTRGRHSPALGVVAIALASVLGCVSLVQGLKNAVSEHGSQDFQWSAARLLLHGTDPYKAYALHGLNVPEGEESPFILSQVPNYPPTALVFLMPYAALDWPEARIAWAIANVVMAIAMAPLIGALLGTGSNRARAVDLYVMAMLFLACLPARNLIGNGQHMMYCLFFFLLAAVQQPKRPILSGVLLAVALLKYTLMFPMTLLFVRQRAWLVLLVALGAHAIIAVLLAAWTGSSVLDLVLGPIRVALSADALAAPLMGYRDMGEVLGMSGATFVVFLSMAILATGTVAAFRAKSYGDALLIVSMTSLAGSFARGYDFVVLLVPVVIVVTSRRWSLSAFLVTATTVSIWYVHRLTFALDAMEAFPWSLRQPYEFAQTILFLATTLYVIVRVASRRGLTD